MNYPVPKITVESVTPQQARAMLACHKDLGANYTSCLPARIWRTENYTSLGGK